MSRLLAVDPGKNKCGLLNSDPEKGIVIEGRVVASNDVFDLVISWHEKQAFQGIILGNGTSSSYWKQKFKDISAVYLVEEYGSTLRARNRYWEIWPPTSFLRFVPRGLLIPPVDLDAIAALVILEDYLKKKLVWNGPPVFKT